MENTRTSDDFHETFSQLTLRKQFEEVTSSFLIECKILNTRARGMFLEMEK